MKFVSPLSEEAKIWLKQVEISPLECQRTRYRAQAIRLSSEGFKINDIATICDTHRNSVSTWIDNWNQFGFDSLIDAPRPGRNPIIPEALHAQVIEIVEANPRQSKKALVEVEQQLTKRISIDTLKRILKKRASPGAAFGDL